jgi:pyrroloquinoline quinone biosynthesis protein E
METFGATIPGGEPLARKDLPELVHAGREAGLYVNMITSGIGLTQERLSDLVDAGLEHLQLSFQDIEEAEANRIAGIRAHAHKLALIPILKRFPLALTINLVVHRINLDRLEEFIAFAESFEPDRLEIAHVQYYGWALKNRHLLMPTPLQVQSSLAVIEKARKRLEGKIHLEAVVPDYYGRFPKACMGGWGRQVILVDPAGLALPCHAARVLPGLRFDSVREHDIPWIWHNSEAFECFRGDSWMPQTCRSCSRKEQDFGGCRCQSFLLTGDARAIDPVCSLSPDHVLLESLRRPADNPLPIWRHG